jgi:hypothetical protein
MTLTAPRQLVKDTSTLEIAFRKVASENGMTSGEVSELWRLVPASMADAPAFLCAIGDMWRYEFGHPIDLPGDLLAVGTQQFPQVTWLVTGLAAARQHLTPEEIISLQSKLQLRDQHEDTLAELAPLARVGTGVRARHEVTGYGSGSRRIDWRFSRPDDVPVLLEVKNRIRDLIQHLAESAAATNAGATEAPEPSTQPELLFRDTVEKFRSTNPSDTLQGVWIFAPIKQEETVLRDYFAGLDHERLHFTILGEG